MPRRIEPNRPLPKSPQRRTSLLGPPIRPPFRGNVLIVEASGGVSTATCDSLTAVGFEVLRAASEEKAASLLRSVCVDAAVVSLAKRRLTDSSIRPGLAILREAPNEERLRVALVHDGPLSSAEQSMAEAFDACLIRSVALTSAGPRNALVEYLLSAFESV